MTIATNSRVYVRTPFKRGTGTVLGVRRDHTVRVCLDSGATVRVALAAVSVLEATEDRRPSANTITRQPDYLRPMDEDPFSEKWVDPNHVTRSPSYLNWIRQQRCAWCSRQGPSEASHHPRKGHGSMGMKTSDLDTIPLCRDCHRDWHQFTALGRMTSDDTKGWCRDRIVHLNQRYMHEVLGVGK